MWIEQRGHLQVIVGTHMFFLQPAHILGCKKIDAQANTLGKNIVCFFKKKTQTYIQVSHQPVDALEIPLPLSLPQETPHIPTSTHAKTMKLFLLKDRTLK